MTDSTLLKKVTDERNDAMAALQISLREKNQLQTELDKHREFLKELADCMRSCTWMVEPSAEIWLKKIAAITPPEEG